MRYVGKKSERGVLNYKKKNKKRMKQRSKSTKINKKQINHRLNNPLSPLGFVDLHSHPTMRKFLKLVSDIQQNGIGPCFRQWPTCTGDLKNFTLFRVS